jgi:Outer membrane lipoprotein-sorting protein
MKGFRAFAAVVVMLIGTARVIAAPPDVATIVSQMKQALEPARSSLRKVTLTVNQEGETATLELGEARGKVGDANNVLLVVLAPADLRGAAFLVKEEAAGANDTTWMYLPAVRRVRTLVSSEAYSAFLNSDFTYADLSFVSTRPTVTLQADETSGGKHVYRLRAVPKESWYYSRIETAVAADSSLPTERQYFDPAGALWKVERWEAVSTIDGVPTALKVSMEDVQAKSASTLTVTALQYGAQVPDTLLQPRGLPAAATSPVWNGLKAPVAR